MVTSKNDLLGLKKRNPTLSFQRLTSLVNNNNVKNLIPRLKTSRSMKRCQHNLATPYQTPNALLLPLSKLLPQLLQISIDNFALPPALRLADRRLFCVHLLPNIFDNSCCIRGLRENI